MPFYRQSFRSLLAENAVDPQELAVQDYIDREMTNSTGAQGEEYLSVRLTKDKTPIISLHNRSEDEPTVGGTSTKMKRTVQV